MGTEDDWSPRRPQVCAECQDLDERGGVDEREGHDKQYYCRECWHDLVKDKEITLKQYYSKFPDAKPKGKTKGKTKGLKKALKKALKKSKPISTTSSRSSRSSRSRGKDSFASDPNQIQTHRVDSRHKVLDPPIAIGKHKGSKASIGDYVGQDRPYYYKSGSNFKLFFTELQSRMPKNLLCLPEPSLFIIDEPYLKKNFKLKRDPTSIPYATIVKFIKVFGAYGKVAQNHQGLLKYPSLVEEASERCQFIATSIHIKRKGSKGKPAINHANVILIDTKKHLIELFEPHGPRTDPYLGDLLHGFYSHILPHYKFLRPQDFMGYVYSKTLRRNVRSIQTTVGIPKGWDGGLCATWCILYVHFRIYNPTKPTRIILKRLKEIDLEYIIRYMKYVEGFIKKKRTHRKRPTKKTKTKTKSKTKTKTKTKTKGKE